MKVNRQNEIKSMIRLCGYSVIFLYFITGYVFSVYKIDGNSMNPLLIRYDRVVSDRLVYKIRDIARGDVVVFLSPADPMQYYIKRIIGLPGETIRVNDGVIYVDNHRVDDSFIPDEFRTSENLSPAVIPLGHYFVAGDHRNTSNDSRMWSVQKGFSPFVPERYIQGKVRFCVWPPSRIGTIASVNPDTLITP